MAAVRDAFSSFVFKKMLKFEAEEADRTLTEYNVKAALGVVGVALGAGVLWRWIKQRAKTARLTRLRKKKQEERQQAMEKLEQIIKKSKITAQQVDAILALNITELLEQIKTGRLTASEVLTAYQIKALEVHKKTNCIVEPIFEAEEWAKQLDQTSQRGPLHGLPISIKDCVAIKGYDSTIGCSQYIDQPYEEDCVLVQVLKQQGAVPFVKTNIPQTMISFESTNPIFGRTANPHDVKRSSGGSSGGEAALVAGGGALAGIGSDVGGSIRNPAAMCGVPGFKPTTFRISTKGGRSLLQGKNINAAWGPLAQDVDGLILIMKAVLSPEMFLLDPTLPVMPFRNEVLKEKRRSLRIGYSFFNGAFEAVPVMRRAVAEAKTLLEASGHQLVPWEESLTRVIQLWLPCMFADGSKEMAALLDCDAVDDAVRLIKIVSSIPVPIRRLLAFILKPLAPELSNGLKGLCGFKNVSQLWDAIKEIKDLRNAIIENWQGNELDAIICPPTGSPALSHGLAQHVAASSSYTNVFNTLDFPAGCVPVTTVTQQDEVDMANYPSFTKPNKAYRLLKKDMKGTVGLPVSVQVVTLPWQDELCLRIMSDLEKAVKSRSSGK